MNVDVQVSLVIDCENPDRLLQFWQALVGGEINEDSRTPTWVALEGVSSLGYLGFQKVPEPKSTKNRTHIDLVVPYLDGGVRRALDLGASAIGSMVEEPTNWFQVLRDPEGNEFCFVQFK